MKPRIKTIILTFIATTVFWCLVVASTFWLFGHKSGVSLVEDATSRGFVAMMSARNFESQPVTFTVSELHANTTSANEGQVVLLERQVPPSGEFWIGITKAKADIKP